MAERQAAGLDKRHGGSQACYTGTVAAAGIAAEGSLQAWGGPAPLAKVCQLLPLALPLLPVPRRALRSSESTCAQPLARALRLHHKLPL